MSLANVKPDIDVSYYIHSTHDLSLADVFRKRYDELAAAEDTADIPSAYRELKDILLMLADRCFPYTVFEVDVNKVSTTRRIDVELWNVESRTVIYRHRCTETLVTKYIHELERDDSHDIANISTLLDNYHKNVIDVIARGWTPHNIVHRLRSMQLFE